MLITSRRIALTFAVVSLYLLTLDALLSFPLLYTIEYTLLAADIPPTDSSVVSKAVWIMPLVASISWYVHPPTLYMNIKKVK